MTQETKTGSSSLKSEGHGQANGDRATAATASVDQDYRLYQKQLRLFLMPHLPPPIVRGIGVIDQTLHPYVGSEATMTISSTLLMSWLVLWLLRSVTQRITGSRPAIIKSQSDNKKLLEASEDEYDATVLLLGPPDGGKTRLYYQLLQHRMNPSSVPTQSVGIPTLTSLRPNAGVLSSERLRIIDWPGIYTRKLDGDDELASVWKGKPRIVVVIDSAQASMGPAADVLYDLLLQLYKERQRPGGTRAAPSSIFVACHKQDLPKAKNPKRIQLQLRTELERLLQVNKAAASSSSTSDNQPILWWPAGEPLELDQLDFCRLHFGVTSCTKEMPENLWRFCVTGEMTP